MDYDPESLNIDKDQILELISKIKDDVNQNPEKIRETVFSVMNVISQIALAYKNKDNQNIDWMKTVKDSSGNPIFNDEESELIERVVLTTDQSGGAFKLSGKLEEMKSNPSISPIDLKDVSIDKAFYGVKDYLQGVSDSANQIAKIVGPVAFVEKYPTVPVGPFPPYLPTKVDVPVKPIIPLVNSLLEALRLIAVYGPNENTFLRKLFTVIMGIFEISIGNWKQSILTFTGYFDKDWVFIGLAGKVFLWIYNRLDMDLQNKLEDILFKSSKSIFVGLWVYLIDLFAPQQFANDLETFMDKAKALKDPNTFCKPETQALLKVLMENPASRLGLEMLNIPTIPVKIKEMCPDIESSPSTISISPVSTISTITN